MPKNHEVKGTESVKTYQSLKYKAFLEDLEGEVKHLCEFERRKMEEEARAKELEDLRKAKEAEKQRR